MFKTAFDGFLRALLATSVIHHPEFSFVKPGTAGKEFLKDDLHTAAFVLAQSFIEEQFSLLGERDDNNSEQSINLAVRSELN